jgi:glycosyltransferase involved in cell wall biosynthesis
VRPLNKLKRIILFIKGIQNTRKIIRQENRENQVDFIFMGVSTNFITTLFYFTARKLKIKFLQERSEYPFLSYNKSLIGKLRLFIYLRIICKYFDGFLVISKALDKYFKPYLQTNTKVFLLPILVETERFDISVSKPENTISYCGSMQGTKDGVPILIEAFSKIAHKFPEVNLQLIGSTSFPEFNIVKNQVQKYGLSNRIIFTGRIEREDLPEYLVKSKILALARPYTKQAEGGFPTKLGEYLAAGRLVVVTAVGEIPDYLTNKETALLAEPGDAENFAELIEFGLNNEELSEKIAENGKKLADSVFNYKNQGIRLYKWLNSLHN